MDAYRGGLDWEILYSKCVEVAFNMCADETITEEESENLQDKFEQMSIPQLKRWLNRWGKVKKVF